MTLFHLPPPHLHALLLRLSGERLTSCLRLLMHLVEHLLLLVRGGQVQAKADHRHLFVAHVWWCM